MEILVSFVFWLVATTLYFGPSIVAICRKHYRVKHIIAVNALSGWTIVGLFIAFAWALSATRDLKQESVESLPSDFGERFFRNRNVVRQPDGGAIVYPGLLAETAYWLNAADYRKYLLLRAKESRKNVPRGLVILALGMGVFLGFREWLGPEHGVAPAFLVFTAFFLIIAIWDLAIRPQNEFLETFPGAPKTRDPIRKQRKILSGLVAFDATISVGATLLCAGLIVSLVASFALGGESSTLRAHDAAITLMGFAVLGGGAAFYGTLSWHHLEFYLANRREPSQNDVDALGTGVKSAQPRFGGNSAPHPR